MSDFAEAIATLGVILVIGSLMFALLAALTVVIVELAVLWWAFISSLSTWTIVSYTSVNLVLGIIITLIGLLFSG